MKAATLRQYMGATREFSEQNTVKKIQKFTGRTLGNKRIEGSFETISLEWVDLPLQNAWKQQWRPNI